MKPASTAPTQYFATLPTEEIAAALRNKIDDYYRYLESSGKLLLWRRVHKAYYSLNDSFRPISSIRSDGVQGELSVLNVNHFENLLTHLGTIISSDKLNYEAQANNSDVRSLSQCILARQILEYYLHELDLQTTFFQGRDLMLKFGEAVFETYWDFEHGADYAVDQMGNVVKEGDVAVGVFGPIDAIRDVSDPERYNKNWHIIRKRAINKYELAAQYPAKADAILSLSNDVQPSQTLENFQVTTEGHDDNLALYVFLHDRTSALPNGRVVAMVGDQILEDAPLPPKRYPVTRMVAKQHGAFAKTLAFDLLPACEAINNLYSSVLSNQLAFGVQNIWTKPGSNISVSQLAGGLTHVESNDKPEPLSLVATKPELFNFIKQLEGVTELLSGINEIVRGQPEGSLQSNSGAAFALLASQSVQFASDFSAAYTKAFEDVGTNVLLHLQQFAVTMRMAVLAGVSNRGFTKQFIGSDIDSIQRIIVLRQNPVAATTSGRLQIADQLLAKGLVKDANEYLLVIQTGRLDPLIEDQETELLLIRSENELLKNGGKPTVISIDEHVSHIKGHRSVISDPQQRNDPQLTQNTLAHIQEHINALQTTNPTLLQVLGQNPLPPPGAPPPPSGPGGSSGPPPPGSLPHGPTPPGAPPPPDPNRAPAPVGLAPEAAHQLPVMPSLPHASPPAAQAAYAQMRSAGR